MPLRTNALQVAAAMQQRAVTAPAEVLAITRHFTMLLETAVKANASGRPGPRVITGDYRRSINGEVGIAQDLSIEGTVGTAKVQGPRLEYGFNGADRLGRIYHQPPYAHFGPAHDRIAPPYAAAIGAALGHW